MDNKKICSKCNKKYSLDYFYHILENDYIAWCKDCTNPITMEKLIGLTISKIIINNDKRQMILYTKEQRKFVFFHEQDCCEDVYIEDICGDLEDIINHPILQSEKVSSSQKDEDNCESQTFTFYKIATMENSITIRWCGKSNGCYSEEVNLVELPLK